MKLKPKAAENKVASMMFLVLTFQNLLPSKSASNKVFKLLCDGCGLKRGTQYSTRRESVANSTFYCLDLSYIVV